MSYTETTNVSFFSRLGNSFSGIGMGLALFVAGTVLLWWNEGDFVATRDALNETQAQTQIVGNAANLGPSFSGKVVHVTGFADTKDVLTDSAFGVSQTAIALERQVEFYQWVERTEEKTQKKLGGGEETVTTYYYDKKWVSSPVDSSSFRDPQARERKVNTQLIMAEDQELLSSNVTFGAYRLPEFFVSSIGGSRAFDVKMDEDARTQIENSIFAANPHMRPLRKAAVQEGTEAPAVSAAPELVHQQGNVIYVGRSPAAPRIGDVRVTFTAVYPADISIIAKFNGNTFEKVYTSNGKTVSRLNMGVVSAEHMFGKAHSSNSTWTWILRVVGTFLVIGGLKSIVAPLSVLASVIPLLGTIVGAGTGLVCSLLGFAWSLVIISIAWLRFRPLIGGAMIAVAALLIAALYFKGRAKKQTPPAAPAASA
ncbi:MAG: TMEM43 family protein [Mailhella sp.]|nr:TMEM43 family protein [Mailhella sp.]MBQ4616608.1 TMEM43 family protein [Mailhella sp.]